MIRTREIIIASAIGEITCRELSSFRFGKCKESVWVDAQSVLECVVTTHTEDHGFSDSPKAQHLQQCCVPYPQCQGTDSALTQKEESHLPESPPSTIFL